MQFLFFDHFLPGQAGHLGSDCQSLSSLAVGGDKRRVGRLWEAGPRVPPQVVPCLAPSRVWQRHPQCLVHFLSRSCGFHLCWGMKLCRPLCCPTHQADPWHSADFIYFMAATSAPILQPRTDSICTVLGTPDPFLSTAISMINSIYYKCTLYYAFYEASTRPQPLKHAFQLQLYLCQNNTRIITLQHKKKNQKIQ